MTHKLLARRLRDVLRPALPHLRHGHALDLLAAAHGVSGWNALCQRPGQPPLPDAGIRRALEAGLAHFGAVPDALLDEAAQLISGARRTPWTGPVAAATWQPPFALGVTASVDVQDWADGLIDEDEDGEVADLAAVQGLARNLDDWAADLEADLPGLSDWARARGWRVSAQELLRWIHARGGGVLARSEGVTFTGRTQVVSLHPDRWVSAAWSFGAGALEAEASAFTQVRAAWTSARLTAATRRAARLLEPQGQEPDGPFTPGGASSALLAALLVLTGETDADEPRQTLAACLSPADVVRAAFEVDDPAVQAARGALPADLAGPLASLAGRLTARGVRVPVLITRREGSMDEWTVSGHVTAEDLTRLVRSCSVTSITLTGAQLTPDAEAVLEQIRVMGIEVTEERAVR